MSDVRCPSCGMTTVHEHLCPLRGFSPEEWPKPTPITGLPAVCEKLERIAAVLEERLPPLSEANENERFKAEKELSNIASATLVSTIRGFLDGERCTTFIPPMTCVLKGSGFRLCLRCKLALLLKADHEKTR